MDDAFSKIFLIKNILKYFFLFLISVYQEYQNIFTNITHDILKAT
jgi:hypothetical protein